MQSSTNQMQAGTVFLKDDLLYIVEEMNGGDIESSILGAREVDPGNMFDVGDPCPVPGCDDGEIVEDDDGSGRRCCSEGCLQWELNHAVEGEDCPECTCDDGTVESESAKQGKYAIKCESCGLYAFGPEVWRESWWPQSRRRAKDLLRGNIDPE